MPTITAVGSKMKNMTQLNMIFVSRPKKPVKIAPTLNNDKHPIKIKAIAPAVPGPGLERKACSSSIRESGYLGKISQAIP